MVTAKAGLFKKYGLEGATPHLMGAVPYTVASLQTFLDFMAKELSEAHNANARRFVDDRFIRELDESGFIASPAS